MLKLIASSISVMSPLSEAVVIDAVPFEIVCVAQRRNDRLGALDRVVVDRRHRERDRAAVVGRA